MERLINIGVYSLLADIVLQVHEGLLMRIVLKYGGSLIFNEDGNANIERIRGLIDVLQKLQASGNHVALSIGGGVQARTAIRAAQDLGGSQSVCDRLGIMAARQNAALLIAGLGDHAYPLVPCSLEEALGVCSLAPEKILVMGGITPGQSTDAVAALLAESLKADLFIRASNVTGVFNKDPHKYTDAKLHDVLTYQQLLKLVQDSAQTAGGYALFDLIAARVIMRSQIPTRFIDGGDPYNIIKAINGNPIGTFITR